MQFGGDNTWFILLKTLGVSLQHVFSRSVDIRAQLPQVHLLEQNVSQI